MLLCQRLQLSIQESQRSPVFARIPDAALPIHRGTRSRPLPSRIVAQALILSYTVNIYGLKTALKEFKYPVMVLDKVFSCFLVVIATT